MSDQKGGRDGEGGFGDDQGTRVGRPSSPDADQPGQLGAGAGQPEGSAARRPRMNEESSGDEGKSTGAGAEAAEGIHAADGSRQEGDRTALDGKETGRGEGKDAGRSGSEPQTSHDREHWSRYGGAGGEEKKGY